MFGIKSVLRGIAAGAVSVLLLSGCANAPKYDGTLRIEDGMLQPMLEFTDSKAPEKERNILRYCVYVETDRDTDGDGMADLVKAFVQVPKGAVEGKYKAAAIYDPVPYNAGIVEDNSNECEAYYLEVPFDYSELDKPGEKRSPQGEMSTVDAAAAADPDKEWNYSVPNSETSGYVYTPMYDYYLERGYAVVEASGIGTYGSEGFELCGSRQERDAHKCVVEWLAGDRIAFTDRTGNTEIKADWSNGNVAMMGISYGGTLCYEVATTGVKGLKTVIPIAGFPSWYDYVNSQGVSLCSSIDYRDYLAGFNCSGLFEDDDWTVLNDRYRSWLWQVSEDEKAANGDYAPIWAESDYSEDYEKISCSALIMQGLNDKNVDTRHAVKMYSAFQKAGQPAKLLLHQDAHNTVEYYSVNGVPGSDVLNKWLAHYLYDVDNDAAEMANLTVQSNVDGVYREYDSFGGQVETFRARPEKAGATSEVTSNGFSEYAISYGTRVGTRDDGTLRTADLEKIYLGMPEENRAVFDIDLPEGVTISGTPEVSVQLSTDDTGVEGLMVTAALFDTVKDGSFKAYMTRDRLQESVPKKAVQLERGEGRDPISAYELVPTAVKAKCLSLGWTDLCNPGGGPVSSEYTKSMTLKKGETYDYTLYMVPTVYTVEKGHQLKLMLTTWDPCRVMPNAVDVTYTEKPGETDRFHYSYAVNNASVEVRLPLTN